MTAHPAIAAVPTNAAPSRALLQAALVLNVAYIMPDTDDPEVFDPRGQGGTPRTIVIGWKGSFFWLDDADGTTAHDGTTCLVTVDGKRYKTFGIDLLVTSVISHTLAAQPVSPAIGDTYRLPVGATGAAWAGQGKKIGIFTARGWFFIAPKVGWLVWTKGSGGTHDSAYHYDSVLGDWIAGLGSTPTLANSIPLSARIGAGASGEQKVQNQTTYAPPGSRKTGATPAMPLGGTAANVNDNNNATTATTGAIGDKTAATVANRIVAQLALAVATDLIAIEVKGLLGSAAASSNAMGLYTSTDGTNWTQAGSGFTLSTSAQDVIRTGSFAGVTHIALVTEAKNWAANTHTLSGLNAYDATVDAAVGDAYIIAANGFGIFTGHATKVAICELEDTLTIYTPVAGDEVYDKALDARFRFNGTAWASAAGTIVFSDKILTVTGSTTAPGSSGYNYSATVAPLLSAAMRLDGAVLTRAAHRSGCEMRFRYEASPNNVGNIGAIALFRDSESAAIDWIEWGSPTDHINVTFVVTAPDALSHVYKVGLITPVAGSIAGEPTRRRFILDELV